MRLEQARAIVKARSYERCEGCGSAEPCDVHHRITRGVGGVRGTAYGTSNDPANMLHLCRAVCHALTLDQPAEAIGRGWVIERRSGRLAASTPALLYTVNGFGWWMPLSDGGYLCCDWEHEYRIPAR